MEILYKKLTHEEFLRLKNQDARIFEMIFKRHSKDIYNFLLLKTRYNYDSAGDLLNDTFIAAYESVPRLSSNKNIHSWLLKIAYRKFLDYIRKLHREEKYRKILHQEIILNKSFEDEIEDKQKRLLLDIALKTLSPEYRNILKLKYEDGKSIKEISSLLEKTDGSVISILSRAKIKLRNEIKKCSKGFVEG